MVLAIVGLLVGGLVVGMVVTPALQPVSVGSEAPDFEAVDLASGDTLGLEAYRGEVVLLNIWATWCVPCEVEMPSIQRLHDELGPEGLKSIRKGVKTNASAIKSS